MDIDLDTGLPVPDHSDEKTGRGYQERKDAGDFPKRSRARPGTAAPPSAPRRPVGRPRKTPPPTEVRNYAIPLAEMFDTVGFACGMVPVRKVQAQGSVFSLNGAALADGLNIAAKANPLVRQGVEWLVGADGNPDAGGAGAIIVAVACMAPFLMNSYLLWNPVSEKKNPAGRADWEKKVTVLAEAAAKSSKDRMDAAMREFTEAQQTAREEAEAGEAFDREFGHREG